MPTIGTYGRTDLDPTVRSNPHRFAFASFFPSGGIDKCMLALHSSESVRAIYNEIAATDFTASTKLDDILYPFIWAVKDEETGNPVLDGDEGSNIYDGNTGGLPNALITPTVLYTDGDPEQPATGKEISSFSLPRDGVNLFALNPFGRYRPISDHSFYKNNEEGEDRTGLYGKGIGLRGPVVLTGWGYDIMGFPFPSGNTADEHGFAGSTSGTLVSNGSDVDPKDYVSAPVDFRYDQFRNVYTTERYETKMQVTIYSGGPEDGYVFNTGDNYTPPYSEDVLPNIAYDVSGSSFITLPATVVVEIMMMPVTGGSSVVPRWIFRNNERSFLAKIIGHTGSDPWTYQFEPIGTGDGATSISQESSNLIEITGADGVDTSLDSYPNGFSKKPIGGQGTGFGHVKDVYVEMFRAPEGSLPNDVRFYFSQVNSHDGDCE